jgi:hypothetical protein
MAKIKKSDLERINSPGAISVDTDRLEKGTPLHARTYFTREEFLQVIISGLTFTSHEEIERFLTDLQAGLRASPFIRFRDPTLTYVTITPDPDNDSFAFVKPV